MPFQLAYHTDIGIRKKTNQDGLLLKTAKTPDGQVGLFAVCDGMGGLSHGELASATVIRGMSGWFDEQLPRLLAEKKERNIVSGLEACIRELNDKILQFGEANKIKLGTTITALLVIYSRYYIVQIGDSRVYSIHHQLKQLTKDQTLVARELERGNLTEEQAKVDPRRNILLQCIGATRELDVTISEGHIEEGALYMLCTDGFYHEVLEEELLATLNPDQFYGEEQMKDKVVELVELVKQRQESDNISVVVAKVTA
ncbi:serine/threonine-protein phosphatase [Mesobacillus foraminis]|uniref:PP2C family protein-serine/threonine phosphatase n=1 Tax=Mesobacillus foraminis TaxID=279826 RepID=UPI001BEA038E|nr:protein phosphatase 2C domain-containing protein [Mesobacillus foraminis]MBT2756657.1 serine/threonine-protein phosphatase [Mesobacillus foraminis]